jgi:hypothetical protein
MVSYFEIYLVSLRNSEPEHASDVNLLSVIAEGMNNLNFQTFPTSYGAKLGLAANACLSIIKTIQDVADRFSTKTATSALPHAPQPSLTSTPSHQPSDYFSSMTSDHWVIGDVCIAEQTSRDSFTDVSGYDDASNFLQYCSVSNVTEPLSHSVSRDDLLCFAEVDRPDWFRLATLDGVSRPDEVNLPYGCL